MGQHLQWWDQARCVCVRNEDGEREFNVCDHGQCVCVCVLALYVPLCNEAV